MNVLLFLGCLLVWYFGVSSIKEAWKRRYPGFVVAGVGDLALATTAAITDSRPPDIDPPFRLRS